MSMSIFCVHVKMHAYAHKHTHTHTYTQNYITMYAYILRGITMHIFLYTYAPHTHRHAPTFIYQLNKTV